MVLPPLRTLRGTAALPRWNRLSSKIRPRPNTNMGAMTSLADLGSGYRSAGLGNSSFGNFADYGTGDFGDYGYGGLERHGIPVR